MKPDLAEQKKSIMTNLGCKIVAGALPLPV
jgi:hypothetical protein